MNLVGAPPEIPRIRLVEVICTGLTKRDGELLVCKGDNGAHYLVLRADTFHNSEVFLGLGSTEQREITEEAYVALAAQQWRHKL